MKTLLFLALALVSVPAFADEQVDVHTQGGGAQDLLNMTQVPPEISDTNPSKDVPVACTLPSGRILRRGMQGYDDCMAAAQGKKPDSSSSVNIKPSIVTPPGGANGTTNSVILLPNGASSQPSGQPGQSGN